jgi:ribosome-binding ATPase YchF (GTP1/OBG family)
MALTPLRAGKPARVVQVDKEDQKAWHMLQLLTSLPALYVSNVDETSADKGNELSAQVAARAAADNAKAVVISAKIDSELAVLDPAEQAEFLESLGLAEPGLNRLIREAYALLGLQSYFTVGPKEARAWTIPIGATGKKVLVLTEGVKPNVYLSARNIERAHVMPYSDASTYHILWSDVVVIESAALTQNSAEG